MFKNRSKVAFLSALLGVSYSVYLIIYFSSLSGPGSAVVIGLITPHLLAVSIGSLFNILGFYQNKKGFIITALVLYSVSGILFLMYLIFVIPMIIMSAISISKVPGKKKSINKNK